MRNIHIQIQRACIALTILLAASNFGTAQYVSDFKRTADAFYEKGDYYSASLYYEKYLNTKQAAAGNGSNYKPYALQIASKSGKKEVASYEGAIVRLAESYVGYNDFANAERYYAIATSFDTADYPLTRYWYAVTLRANTKYADAETQLGEFLEGYRRNDEYVDKAKRELANCQFIQEQLANKKNTLTVRKMSSFINQGGATYAPLWLNDNTFLFTSSKADSAMIVKSKGKNPYFNNLYRANLTDTSFSRPEKVEVAVGDMQQGVASFTPGEKKMFLTRWEQKEGKNRGAIYMSEKSAGNWSEPVKLNGNINIEGYSSIQPFVTGDGKYLVFSSDRPGGVGKYDLWYCLLDASLTPGSATNMGTTINTKDDEQAPYFHTASSTLVFASNGRVGMGGYDLFKTNGDFRNWSEVKNMGFPVNSTKDDIYFFSKGKKYMMSDVYFSSDRNSVCCLELYDAKKVNLFVTGKVLDCVTKEPMVGAKISVVDTVLNKVIYSQQLDATGSYGFEMEEYQPLKLVAEKQYYYPRSMHFYQPGVPGADTLFNPALCMPHEDTAKPYPVGKPVVMKDIYYDFDKATLRPESYPVLDTLAKVLRMYPKMEIEIGSHTDSKGTDAYNMKLSAARAKSCVDYLIKVGIESERMHSMGYGESMPVAPNTTPGGKDNPDGRALNRRTEVKVLHY